jgi:predicted metal-dependent hydrolase
MAEFPDSELASAIVQFNQQDFYACHDTLEAIWVEAPTDQKKFYQGLLQVAVAYYHLGNSNWRGAVVLLGEGRFRLLAYAPSYAGIDVERLRQDTAVLFTDLQAIAPELVGTLVAELTSQQRPYPQIHWI